MKPFAWKSSIPLFVFLAALNISVFAQSPLDKAAALNAIATKWASLPHTDLASDSQALLAFVQARSEFSDAGIVTGSTCVWARFNDGRTVLIANNVPEPAPPAGDSTSTELSVGHREIASFSPLSNSAADDASGTPEELPSSSQARLIHTISGFATAVPDIRPWLTAAAYNVIDDPGTIASLRQVQGDGVLYFEGHGGQWLDNSPGGGKLRFAIWTADTIDLFGEDNDPLMKDDLDNGRVLYMLGEQNVDPITKTGEIAIHYGITSVFVSKYWSFSANSLVFLTVCDSFTGDSADFKNAVLTKGASVYAGWTGAAGAIVAVRSARLVFDRLLGANADRDPSILEADFKQRPFDYVSIQRDLPLHNLGAYGAASLLFTPYVGTQSFALLAPSIVVATLFETDVPGTPITARTLQLGGVFGSDPGVDPDSKVTVGGQDCPVKPGDWHSDYILCSLPAGAAGDVVVSVRKHSSNKGRLTKWNGTIRSSIIGDGSLRVLVTYNVAFRSDVRRFRLAIHDPPSGPFLFNPNVIADESSASYTCSGSATDTFGDLTETITWSGGGNMSASHVVPAPDNSFQMVFSGLSAPTVMVNVDQGKGPGCDWTTVTTGPDGTITSSGHSDFSSPAPFDIGALPVEPNDPSFAGGSKSDSAACFGPPAFTVPKCRVDWDTFTAMLPPDATSAR